MEWDGLGMVYRVLVEAGLGVSTGLDDELVDVGYGETWDALGVADGVGVDGMGVCVGEAGELDEVDEEDMFRPDEFDNDAAATLAGQVVT